MWDSVSPSGRYQGSLSDTRSQKDHRIGKASAIERYLIEEDAWKEFLVVGKGEQSDWGKAVARESQQWDDVLEKVFPDKNRYNSKP